MSEAKAKAIANNQLCGISQHECRAMRALKCDGYSHGEIAFMFECKDVTAAQHVKHECSHDIQTVNGNAAEGNKDYSDAELLTAYRNTYRKQPYCKMSQPAYERHRDAGDPSASTIQRRFGSWLAARKIVWGESDG